MSIYETILIFYFYFLPQGYVVNIIMEMKFIPRMAFVFIAKELAFNFLTHPVLFQKRTQTRVVFIFGYAPQIFQVTLTLGIPENLSKKKLSDKKTLLSPMTIELNGQWKLKLDGLRFIIILVN